MASWLQTVLEGLPGALVNGVVLGTIIALAAVGLTLIYGVLQIPTFAHGDVLTLGAYLGWALLAPAGLAASANWLGLAAALLTVAVGIVLYTRDLLTRRTAAVLTVLAVLAVTWDVWTMLAPGLQGFLGSVVQDGARMASALATAALAMAGLGVASHYLLWRPLKRRGAKMVMLMIASIGLAFFLRGVIQFIWQGQRRIYALNIPELVYAPMATRITSHEIVAFLVAALGVVGVHLFLTRTTTGKMMRALADNPDLALVTGIDVPRLTRLTWGLGSALAGAAGVLYASIQQGLTPETGWILLLSIFAAVILGGIGSAQGAILASLIIFVAQEVSVVLTAPLDVPLLGPEYKVAVGFGILILTLLVRPQGLMGVEVR